VAQVSTIHVAVGLRPDGHLKFLHLWPGQIPPGQDRGMSGDTRN
jgi:hypothetical protein